MLSVYGTFTFLEQDGYVEYLNAIGEFLSFMLLKNVEINSPSITFLSKANMSNGRPYLSYAARGDHFKSSDDF